MEAEPKIVGLFGMLGVGNFGNDGSLESMVRFLRRVAPQERLLCICGNPAAVEKDFGLEAVSIYGGPRIPIDGRAGALLRRAAGTAAMWLHAIRCLRRLRALVVPGMGVLDDFEVGPLGWPHDLLIWFLLARLMGVKVALVSIGAGPIRHPVSRWLMKGAAQAAHYRSYRDPVSKTFMESIGFDTSNDPIYPDIAFSLPAPAATRKLGGDRPLTIGVGVMAYRGWRDTGSHGAGIYAGYIEKMTGFVVWLLDRGHPVRILMGDEMDRRAVDDLLRAVRSRRPDCAEDSIVFAPAHTLHDIMQQMADTDLVVATRYHNVVCALRVGKPTISIGYAKKNDALLAEAGLADYCQHVERLDVERLKAQTMQLISNRLAAEAGIAQALERFESRLREQEDLLLSLIRSGPARAHGAPLLDAQSPAA